MVNQKITDYIRVELSAGNSEEAIREALVKNGWCDSSNNHRPECPEILSKNRGVQLLSGICKSCRKIP